MPASMPEMMSVSMRSPTISACSRAHPSSESPVRIIRGLGLPTKYAFTPVANSIGATSAPHAGMMPSSAGPVRSGLVPISFAPLLTRLTARLIVS